MRVKRKFSDFFLFVSEIMCIFATEFSLLHHLNINHYGKKH